MSETVNISHNALQEAEQSSDNDVLELSTARMNENITQALVLNLNYD